MDHDLAESLRAWRDRTDPALLPATAPVRGVPGPRAARRAPGWRREEVAAQAGISVNYLMRLEQGRAHAPSPSVVAGLARALRLDPAETAHLHRVAGHADPTTGAARRGITPSVQRVLDRLGDVPVIVVDAAWTIVAANPLAGAFLGGDPIGENAARRQFLGPVQVERELAEEERYERDLVGDLHRQRARHPADTRVADLVEELLAASGRFAQLWAERPSGFAVTSRKSFRHPVVGRVTVDCDVLEVVGSDLRVVVWTADPGTADAEALGRLAATLS